jgi:hypothetical protein
MARPAKPLKNFGVLIDPGSASAAFRKLAVEASKEGTWYRVDWNAARNRSGAVEHQAKVLIRLEKTSTGSPVCTGLVLGAFDVREVTGRGLRGLPVVDFIRAIGKWERLRDESGPFAKGFRRYTPPVRRGPHGLGDGHYQMIAALYRDALRLEPRAPLKALKEQLLPKNVKVSDSTIHGWIRQARQRGFLGKAVIGKAGEKPKEKS